MKALFSILIYSKRRVEWYILLSFRPNPWLSLDDRSPVKSFVYTQR